MSGKVFLVGAGPGDPGLLTRKAARLIEKADVVVLDALVSPEIAALIPPGTEIIDAGKRASKHTLKQEETNQLLVDLAKAGKRVVRLKGGDPFVFGRGGEEAEELRMAGVEFEIVPGISSSIAGPAYAGIPVTHRSYSTAVTLVTGHESDESKGVQWKPLAELKGTIVFLMGLGNLEMISTKLVENGRSADTPAAVISRATTPRQRTVTGTLANIRQRVEEAKIEAPALIVVGDVVQAREQLDWFEKKPLFGRSVVVTRARAQASDLAELLGEAGAKVLEFPMISIAEPESWDSLDKVIAAIGTYDYVVFSSINGVQFFFRRLMEKGRDVRALSHCQVAAVGSSTAEELRSYGIVPDVIPEKFQSSALLPMLPQDQTSIRTAIIRAAEGRDELIEGLRARGGSVDLGVAYRNVESNAHAAELQQLLRDGGVDAVTFTSASTVDNFFRQVGETKVAERIALASIGPVTTAAIRKYGRDATVEAKEATVSSLCEAVVATLK